LKIAGLFVRDVVGRVGNDQMTAIGQTSSETMTHLRKVWLRLGAVHYKYRRSNLAKIFTAN
jgi:hypothetical protein